VSAKASVTSLAHALDVLRTNAKPATRTAYDHLIDHLIDSGAVANALKVGDRFPSFQLASAEGRFVRLEDILSKGPAVVSFYRGAWCPYCFAELTELDAIVPDVRALGAEILAITPEAGGAALRTKVDRELDIEILCDLDSTLALECGLVFRLPDDLRQLYLANGLDLAHVLGNDSWFLPVPATYVVDSKGVIVFAYTNPDFRYRLEPSEVLNVLRLLKA
jgi:peroxiredoxin